MKKNKQLEKKKKRRGICYTVPHGPNFDESKSSTYSTVQKIKIIDQMLIWRFWFFPYYQLYCNSEYSTDLCTAVLYIILYISFGGEKRWYTNFLLLSLLTVLETMLWLIFDWAWFQTWLTNNPLLDSLSRLDTFIFLGVSFPLKFQRSWFNTL